MIDILASVCMCSKRGLETHACRLGNQSVLRLRVALFFGLRAVSLGCTVGFYASGSKGRGVDRVSGLEHAWRLRNNNSTRKQPMAHMSPGARCSCKQFRQNQAQGAGFWLSLRLPFLK